MLHFLPLGSRRAPISIQPTVADFADSGIKNRAGSPYAVLRLSGNPFVCCPDVP